MNKVFIESNNFFTRWPCVVCGGVTDKMSAHPMVRLDGDGYHLCDQCFESGAEGIKPELINHADCLEARAKALRQLAAEPWTVPTMAELHAFRKKIEDAFESEYMKEEI